MYVSSCVSVYLSACVSVYLPVSLCVWKSYVFSFCVFMFVCVGFCRWQPNSRSRWVSGDARAPPARTLWELLCRGSQQSAGRVPRVRVLTVQVRGGVVTCKVVVPRMMTRMINTFSLQILMRSCTAVCNHDACIHTARIGIEYSILAQFLLFTCLVHITFACLGNIVLTTAGDSYTL